MGFSTDIDNLITYLSDAPTNEQLKVLTSLLPKLKLEGGSYESLTFLLNYLSSGGDTAPDISAINNKLPDAIDGKVPVLVEGLSVTVDNAQLEIKNDEGNPVPVTGTVTANTGLTQPLTDTQLRASAVPVSLSSLPALPTGSNTIGAISNTSFTANAGTNLNTSLLALESGGNLASINNKLNSQVVSSSTVTTVNAVASDTTLLASNANRKGFIIFNNSTAILYILLASGTSSNTNFSILLNQNESLIIDNTCLYTGVVKGIWASATGDCKVTEFS